MNALLRSLALAALLPACAAVRSETELGRGPASAPAPTADTAEVRAVFTAGIAAFNRHDLDAFARQFAPDIRMYTPTGWLRGEAAVRERFAATFRQFPRVRMEVEELRTHAAAPGTVTVDFRWRVHPMGQGPAFHGVGSGVYVRREGRWVEVLEHETVSRVDEPLRSAPAGP